MKDTSNMVGFDRAPRYHDDLNVDPATAQPFVKWAGGKRSLVSHLDRHFPNSIDTYWEPFVGGGAVFFNFVDRITRAHLSDSNLELIITYMCVKNNARRLIERLREHAKKHREKKGRNYANGRSYYYRVRNSKPQDAVEVAARFIYLNKAGYNGLYRVNNKGQFNVPEGRYHNPDICNEERILAASRALTKANIIFGDFSEKVDPGRGDFIYCDPPYDGCFTGYRPNGFNRDSQTRLRDAANEWRRKGATIVLSNAATEAMRTLYKGWKIYSVKAPRSINSKADGREPVSELIITNG